MKHLAVLVVLLLTLQACSTKKSGDVTPEPQHIKITLTSPANGSTVANAGELKFTWTASVPDAGSPVSYKMKIVEIKSTESPEQALKGNKPFFEKDSLEWLTTNYPPTAPALKAGSKYAWRVVSTQKGIKDSSAAAMFTMAAREAIVITPGTPTNNSTVANPDELKFSWTATIPDAGSPVSYKIKIVEIKGDESPENAIRTNKPHFEKDSMNYLTYDYPPTAPALKPGGKYAWNITSTQKGIKDSSAAVAFTMVARDPIIIALLTPANNGTINVTGGLEFTWLPTIPNASSPVFYKIKIVEIKGDESPENAIGNKPLFEKDSIPLLKFNYPAVAPMLKTDTKYVWHVVSTQRGWKDSSAVSTFTISAGPAAVQRGN